TAVQQPYNSRTTAISISKYMKNISLAGCCGSIGRQVLDIVRRHPDQYRIVSLITHRDTPEYRALLEEFNPVCHAVDEKVPLGVAEEEFACDEADVCFNAAGGFAGFAYSLEAAHSGKILALANKESLVCGADYVIPAASWSGTEIIPVDSEHSAIWQCMHFNKATPVKELVLTASGGPFRGRAFSGLENVTPAEALRHPTWKMGKKITIDSATLVNKAYEVIEAHALFGVPYDCIKTVLQPQSIVHSLVGYEDGAYLAQMSIPSMEVPIQLALTYPDRYPTSLSGMDFTRPFSLDFEPLNPADYPLYSLALACGKAGGMLPCIFNAADEVAVQAFLEGEISFTQILDVCEAVAGRYLSGPAPADTVLPIADNEARIRARELVARIRK
ncbi:MAG: 1-deoxy-D-xylulose-5-phosphate reductoisomerase, partial [Clostridia bacterium]|nr:1-deoxy-D-xylulose-5-phosphate reductoisomerase [Clostridia bacterium]